MQIRANKLRGLAIGALDEEIGKVTDIYFDDEWWAVRYFVVRTGSWLGGREVLISTQSVRAGDWPEDALPVELTREQVEQCPPVDTSRPVSRHYEMAHAAHYRNNYYWNGPHSWAAGPFGTMLGTAQPRPGIAGREMEAAAAAEHEAAERSHLRSVDEMIGYDVVASDEPAGHVDDMVIETASWRIADLVVDTRTWMPGGEVIVRPEMVEHIDWSTSSVRLKLSREELRNSPDAA